MNRRGRGGGGPWAPKSAWECKTKKPKSHTRPPNLRGREIGMYYKKLSQERREAGIEVPKTPKPFMLGFGIPPGLESRVRVNLETISKLATDLNISINPTENIFPIKKEVIDQDDQSEPSTSTEGNNCHPKVGTDKFNINWEPNVVSAKASAVMFTEDINNDEFHVFKKPNIPSTSSAPDFIPVSNENSNHYGSGKKLLSLRGGGDYKYGYEDIITGSFDEKLDECIKKGVGINVKTQDILDISANLYEEYKVMECKPKYKKMMEFRKKLPTYKKAPELLNVIEENQVIVISGETGCGKSTQVPQLILDNALRKCLGANTHILCTQPRRIAASSLAMRVAEERAEQLGNSVGYAVRLEKVESRPRGSIMYVTTGILLADLETDQGLTSYSHVILDEVHERDCHIDLSMCMLKKVLKKRKEMKLILMSATIDAEKLSQYFDDCPMIHIEGLAYPVEDVYLEDILLMTNYKLPPETSQPFRGHGHRRRERRDANMEPAIKYRAEIDGWLSQQCRNRPEIHRIRDTLADHRIEDINIELIVDLLICLSKEPPGAILVFVPGIGDITKMIKVMESTGAFPRYYFDIYPLHSKLATLDQHRIFERPREGVRKIIIATNIAETSITIDDIVYVVDCAKLKISGLNVQDNVSTLKVEWVSQANLRQRRGRAGRCQPGICYHLVTSYRAGKLAERLLPELQRSDLLEPVLSIKRLRLGMAADAMSILPAPPAQSTVDWAVKHLQQCGALNSKETLTPLGWHLARLPVHPSAGKLLLLGALFGCLDRAASVAAVWGFKDPFQLVIGKEREVDEAKRRFSLGEPSDHLAISEAIIQWEKCSPHSRFNFAYRNFLSNNTLELLSDMKNQLGDSLKQMGFLPTGNVKASWENRNADNLSLFKAIVAASLYPKIAMVRWMGLRKNRPRVKVILPEFGEAGRRQKVTVHPSSIMATGYKTNCVQICRNPGANWCVYWILQRSSDLFLIDVTLVYTLPLLFFGELVVKVFEETEEDGEMCLMSISSVNVRCKKTTAITLIELRALLDQVLASRVTVAGRDTVHCDFQECVLNAVIELITAEDERAEYVGDDDSSETSEVE